MPSRIEMKVSPSVEERASVLRTLMAYNDSRTGDSASETLALLVRDSVTDAIIGGLHGEFFYKWLFIELLALAPEIRKGGIGSKLLEMAEQAARDRGCTGIWLDTFDFQAPRFYQRHGFTEFGVIEDFPEGHKRHFYQKRLR
ncbi:GNAT family N-acetyltransferase [Pantoea sp. Ap-967]|uniref:GNAT family N-acetyltransferase n=1 Tax=Pantoea sp. Ap-967 TaxID=2608362 RepID=UPI00141DE1AC|nr:GNAT family N-acetyltransferase [Pantoea sp. Ap-967]NIE72960.1 GNAT family N-acetyltransferase [Pantoea sp. Ap-967]